MNFSENSDTNESGTPPVSPQKWSVEEVETYIREAGFPSESIIFKEQEIDGRSLLLLRRMDVLTGLSLKIRTRSQNIQSYITTSGPGNQ